MDPVRIYVAVAATVQIGNRTVIQPVGRQVAQVAHVVSKLRFELDNSRSPEFEPVTTIVLQARDSAELAHVSTLLVKRKLSPVSFSDTNAAAYGEGVSVITAIAVMASKKKTVGVLDYLPLWGAK